MICQLPELCWRAEVYRVQRLKCFLSHTFVTPMGEPVQVQGMVNEYSGVKTKKMLPRVLTAKVSK
ncbi:MAG: hypothetical protein CME88_08665 [Hirschia sp.]|nr:hypothetical protein [Hirschia sp.]